MTETATKQNVPNPKAAADAGREITLDTGRCNGCLGCVGLNPDVFGWDENLGLPFLKRDRATPEEINEALTCCPKQCIGFAD